MGCTGCCHYSVLINIQGSSNEETFSAREMEPLLDRESLQDTFYRRKGIRRRKSECDEIIYVGKYVIDPNGCVPMMTTK